MWLDKLNDDALPWLLEEDPAKPGRALLCPA